MIVSFFFKHLFIANYFKQPSYLSWFTLLKSLLVFFQQNLLVFAVMTFQFQISQSGLIFIAKIIYCQKYYSLLNWPLKRTLVAAVYRSFLTLKTNSLSLN